MESTERRRLLDAYFDDELSNEELAVLEQMLNQDADLLKDLLNESYFHMRLRLKATASLEGEFIAENPDGLLLDESLLKETTSEEEPEASSKPMLDFLGDCFNSGISFLGRHSILITVLLPLLAIITVLSMSPTLWKSPPQGWALAARVVQTIDCQWKHDIHPGTDSFLVPGQKLELELGLAELEFASGARVVLEGPAELTIAGHNSSDLAVGRLAATVPEGAEGFTVETPNLEVVDLGTEFGVMVEEDGCTDVHVFKGAVETKVTRPVEKTGQKEKKQIVKAPGKKKFRLKKDEAVQYNQTTNNIARIPIDKKRFVRSLDRSGGVTSNLRISNPSFEQPDIRTVKEYRSEHGNTIFRPIYGWKISNRNLATSQVAQYQISPYTFLGSDGNDVGPSATEGRQVVAISLGVKPSLVGRPRSNWIYQSLGVVNSDDVGKTLKLSVDAGPRSAYGGLTQGNGTVFAGFALRVTPDQSGKFLGHPDTFKPKGEIKQLGHLEASVQITVEYVGQEMFVLLAVSDDGSDRDVQQYYFDNVEVSVQD